MKKQLLIVGIIVLLVCVGLSGCTNNPTEQKITTASQDKFLGTWSVYHVITNENGPVVRSLNYTWIFYPSGDFLTITAEESGFYLDDYKVEGDKFITSYIPTGDPEIDAVFGPEEYSYSFTNDYKSLTLTDLHPKAHQSYMIYLEKQNTEGQDKFIGTWYGRTEQSGHDSHLATMIFYPSGNLSYNNGTVGSYEMNGYRVEDNKLYFDYEAYPNEPDMWGYSFTNDCNSLTLCLLNPLTENDEDFMFLFHKQNSSNVEPIVSCSADVTNGTIPLTVHFTSSGRDIDGTIESYEWNFYKGLSSPYGTSSLGQNVTHTFSEAGIYYAFVTVTDDKGVTAKDGIRITVTFPDPVILKNTSYSYLDSVYVDGIVKNVANVPINNVNIKVTLYDKSNNIIKTSGWWDEDLGDYYDSAHPYYIKPEETAFFHVSFGDVPYYDHYDIEIISFDSGYISGCGESLAISDIQDNIGVLGYEVTGTLKNEGLYKLTLVGVWGAFYDSSGNLLCIEHDYTLPLDLYSGQEETFTITAYEFGIDISKISSYELKTDEFC